MRQYKSVKTNNAKLNKKNGVKNYDVTFIYEGRQIVHVCTGAVFICPIWLGVQFQRKTRFLAAVTLVVF